MRGVILTTVGRKNPLHSVDALTAHAILRCEAPKNLLRNVCHSERSVSGVKNPKQKARDSSHSVNRPRFGMTFGVMLSESEASPICNATLYRASPYFMG